MSWWLPQQIELLSAALLLSNPSSDGNRQTLDTGKSTFDEFVHKYEENLVILVYLLFGVYLQDDYLLSILSNNDIGMEEEQLLVSIKEKIANVTELIRASVQYGCNDSYGTLNDQHSFDGLEESSMHDRITWKSVSNKAPRSFSTSNNLFTLSVPADLRYHLSLESNSSTIIDTSSFVNFFYLFNMLDNFSTNFSTIDCNGKDYTNRSQISNNSTKMARKIY